MQREVTQALAWNVASIRAAEELELHVREIRMQITRFLLTHDPSHLEQARALQGDTQYWLEEATRLASTPAEQVLMEQARTGMDDFLAAMHDFSVSELTSMGYAKIDELSNVLLTNRVLTPAHEYLDVNEKEVLKSSRKNQGVARRVVLALLLLGTCGSIAGLAAGYGIARGISRSIVQLIFRARDVDDKLEDVTEPVSISLFSEPPLEELDSILQKVSDRVTAVINQLRQSHRETIRSEQLAAVGQLAAGVAHELRNPLMCMKLLVQAASKRAGSGRLEGRDLQVLVEEIGRLESLVQTLLDFARPGQLKIARVELREVVDQTVSLLAGRASRQQTVIQFNRPDEEMHVEADFAQIRQVVLNLLLNALDATPDGGEIHIALYHERGRYRHARKDSVVFEVRDTGRGFPDTLGDRIFEPFVSTKETGVGLGLVICKRIVESHGGTVVAMNGSGTGATFIVRLPVWSPTQFAVGAAIDSSARES
jgi:signal transduction histidine kinase